MGEELAWLPARAPSCPDPESQSQRSRPLYLTPGLLLFAIVGDGRPSKSALPSLRSHPTPVTPASASPEDSREGFGTYGVGDHSCEDGAVRLLSLVHDTLTHHRIFSKVKCEVRLDSTYVFY